MNEATQDTRQDYLKVSSSPTRAADRPDRAIPDNIDAEGAGTAGGGAGRQPRYLERESATHAQSVRGVTGTWHPPPEGREKRPAADLLRIRQSGYRLYF